MTKPYENQLLLPPDELEEQFYYGLNLLKSVCLLIGTSESQKESWIERNKEDDAIVLYSQMDLGSWYNKLLKKRDMAKEIKSAVDQHAPIIFFGDTFLTKESRSFLFDYFPRYRKHAIVWEEDLGEMISLGYDRPSLDEGFDDFTYII